MRGAIDLVAGTRAALIRLAAVAGALTRQGRVPFRVVHAGHRHDETTRSLFEELKIPPPEAQLEPGSGPEGAQTANVLKRYEARLLAERPAATVVFGDVSSAMACALAAVKLGVPVAHVEAGARCFDRSLPEEINRLVTDAVSELLLVSEESGLENLRREGIPDAKVHLVGNVTIDQLLVRLPAAREQRLAEVMGLRERGYGLVTLHHPSNVDEPKALARIVDLLHQLSVEVPLVFPIHPRTRGAARKAGIEDRLRSGHPRLMCFGPLSYLDTLALLSEAALVLTDSDSLQDESTVLGVPCLTLRESTERPVTVQRGTNRLVGNDPDRIRRAFVSALRGDWPHGQPIPFWDGKAAERVAAALATRLD